jgi:hypothetical protein|tara:strand:- start:756 stop:1109 length:354 start_codon:yes stop_codon:yes gene_type:complete
MAHYEDLHIDQGTDVSIEIYLVNPDGSVKNLTGYSVAASLATRYDAPTVEKTNFTAAVKSPATDGIVALSLTNAQSQALNPKKRYVYDVEISVLDGAVTVVERVLEGKITISPSVTE